MRHTLRIQKVINRYKAYKRYKKMMEEINKEYVEHYLFYEMSSLREIALLKAENPTKFRIACALDKLVLN